MSKLVAVGDAYSAVADVPALMAGIRSIPASRPWKCMRPGAHEAATRDNAVAGAGATGRIGGHVSPFPHSSQSCHGTSGSPNAVSNDFCTTRLSLTGSVISSSFRRCCSIIFLICSSVRRTVTARLPDIAIGSSHAILFAPWARYSNL